MKRRFESVEGLHYDPSRDVVYLRGGYRGVAPIVGVRSVSMDSDIVHLNDLMVRDEVTVRGGSIIKGNILAESGVRVDVGEAPSLIAGDVGVIGEKGIFQARGAAPLVVFGNIFAERVEVGSPAVIIGNVVARREAVIGPGVLLLGRVLAGSEGGQGKLSIERSTVYQAYAFGDIRVGSGVSVLTPLVAAKGGELRMESERVRVLSFPCIFCGVAANPLVCEHYLSGRCPLEEKGMGYDYLSRDFDLSKAEGYHYLSWYWRSSPLMAMQAVLAKKLLFLALRKAREVSVEMEKKMVSGVPLEKLPSELPLALLKELRGEARGAVEEVKMELFRVIEEYYSAKGLRYWKCPKCGMPNPEGVKLCIYCGEFAGKTEHAGAGP